MRRWTLTLFLMIAAGIAVALAPRLMAAFSTGPAVLTPPQVPLAHDIHLLDTGTAAPPHVAPPPPPPQVIPEATVARPPITRPRRAPRPARSDLLIPELDEQPQVDWSQVPPPAAPQPDPHFWDDCPGCGMG